VTSSPARQQVVLVSGLSGAGKASVMHALEDLGFEAVDNPPLPLFETLVGRPDGAGARRLALGVDARTRGFDADAVVGTLGRLRQNPTIWPELIFAWADETVLLRRYTETRRRHPLAPEGRVLDGIAAEQELTAPLRDAADWVIDTSDLPPADLRRMIERRYGALAGAAPQAGLAVTLVSFAFAAGLPREADMVFDTRFLRNPHYVPSLRALTGREQGVGAYIEGDPDFAAFFKRVTDLLDLVLPRFVQEGKKYATVGVGCTGGRHRSVYIVEKLGQILAEAGWRVTVTHRELARSSHPVAPSGANPVAQAQEA
jgi:UPF0042 nucleotide-binding protein